MMHLPEVIYEKICSRKFLKIHRKTHVFSCNFCKIFKNTFCAEHLWTTAAETFHRPFNTGLLFYCKFWFFNSISTKPTKWSNSLKQFLGNIRRIVWVCLTFCGLGTWVNIFFNTSLPMFRDMEKLTCSLYHHKFHRHYF